MNVDKKKYAFHTWNVDGRDVGLVLVYSRHSSDTQMWAASKIIPKALALARINRWVTQTRTLTHQNTLDTIPKYTAYYDRHRCAMAMTVAIRYALAHIRYFCVII